MRTPSEITQPPRRLPHDGDDTGAAPRSPATLRADAGTNDLNPAPIVATRAARPVGFTPPASMLLCAVWPWGSDVLRETGEEFA